jgi:hypothetical protein
MSKISKSRYTDSSSVNHQLEPLAVDLNGVRQLLGVSISDTTIWRLEKKGLIKRVPGIRTRLFTVKSIREMVETASLSGPGETR